VADLSQVVRPSAVNVGDRVRTRGGQTGVVTGFEQTARGYPLVSFDDTKRPEPGTYPPWLLTVIHERSAVSTQEQHLPAVREATRLDELARLGQWLALSESGENSEKARGAAAALRLYYISELGLTPMAAAELSLIKGRLYVGAQLLRALAIRAGYRVYRVDSSDTACTARLVDQNSEVVGEATYTLEQAKTAGIIRQGSPWVTHPARMLWARASKNAIVDFAPEVALGFSLDDELHETNPGVEVSYDPYLVDEDIPFGDPLEPEADNEAELATIEALQEMADE
jgi:hypothetical protein